MLPVRSPGPCDVHAHDHAACPQRSHDANPKSADRTQVIQNVRPYASHVSTVEFKVEVRVSGEFQNPASLSVPCILPSAHLPFCDPLLNPLSTFRVPQSDPLFALLSHLTPDPFNSILVICAPSSSSSSSLRPLCPLACALISSQLSAFQLVQPRPRFGAPVSSSVVVVPVPFGQI